MCVHAFVCESKTRWCLWLSSSVCVPFNQESTCTVSELPSTSPPSPSFPLPSFPLLPPPLPPPQGCPFLMDIYSEQCEAELEIVDVLQCSDTVDPALCKLGVAKGVSGELKGCDDGSVVGHAYTLPHWAMIAVENKVRATRQTAQITLLREECSASPTVCVCVCQTCNSSSFECGACAQRMYWDLC